MVNHVRALVNAHISALTPKTSSPQEDSNVVRLDLSELAYSPSPHVIEAINQSLSGLNRYPDATGDSVRKALASYTGARAEQIFVGNGSDDLIELVAKVFIDRGEEAVIPIPTFYMYWHATKVVGGSPVFVDREANFGLGVDKLVQRLTTKTKVIFLANPNNPTANLIPRDAILELLRRVECIVVVDECYFEMCKKTVVDLVDTFPNLIVLRSFSKSFGLAGLRIGYGVANESSVDYLYRATQPFPVNRVAQIAALAALDDINYAQSRLEQMVREKELLSGRLEQMGLHVYPSVTNFLFVHTRYLKIPSNQLVRALYHRGILVRDFGLQPGLDAYHIRIAVGTSQENQVLVEALTEAISELRENGK